MSNCNQVNKEDNFSRSSPKNFSHYSRGEMKDEIAFCNDNDQDVSCQKAEKVNDFSQEDEKYTLVSLIPPSWKKIICGEASKIKNETSSEKSDVNEKDILKLDFPDAIRLENEEADEDDIKISDDMADACKTSCKICHKIVNLTNMRNHTKSAHNLQITDYKHIYGNFEIIKMVYHKCYLCGKTVLLDNDCLGGHIKGSHKMKEKEYKEKYMKLVNQRNDKEIKKDADADERYPQNDQVKTGLKRKFEKVDHNSSFSKVSKGSKERPLSSVQKQKQNPDISNETSSAPGSIPKKRQKLDFIQKQKQDHGISIDNSSDPDYIPKKQQKSKHSFWKTKIETNRVNKEIIDGDKDKDTQLSVDDIFDADNIIENSQETAKDNTIDSTIVKDIQDNPKHVAKDNTESIEDVLKDASSDNVAKGIVVNKHTDKDFIDKSEDVDKDDTWISDSENNDLYRNGGPSVESGWKFCFEARTIDGFTVMIAKYKSPDGNVYFRGEDGYQIPELMR